MSDLSLYPGAIDEDLADVSATHFRDYVKKLANAVYALEVAVDAGGGGGSGNTILSGAAAPTTEGSDGDFYIRVVAGVPTTIYGPKAGGVWPSGTDLQGPAGADGTDGADGDDGVDGNTILYGTAAPTTEGVDGDFYIRLVAGVPTTVYGPKASGTWPSGSGLQGATGATGSAGTNGNTILYGTAAPTTEGVNGDFYIRLVGSVPTTIYGPKAAGTWPSGSGLQGATGATGADATAIYGDPVTIAHGGTGQTTAAAGLAALGGAPTAGPTFTGTVTIPTPSAADNSTKAASTAFVQGELAGYITKALAAAKGDLYAASANDTPVIHSAGANGTFLTYNSANSDGLENRVLAYTDMWTLPRWTVAGTVQTITTGTGGEVLNTAVTESVDTHGFHSNALNPERITIPTGLGGTYLIMPKVSWASTAGASGFRRINILINGSTTNTVYIVFPASSTAINFGCTLIVTLSAADILELEAVHTQGSDLGATMSEWTGIRIGP